MNKLLRLAFVMLAMSVKIEIHADEPTFKGPGDLQPGSGSGNKDARIYYPALRFPLENGPAFLNSQVYRKGGDHGPAGSQCDKENYTYPWRDNFCEKRTWGMPLCPDGEGHQGQDIRPSSCKADTYWAVAVEDGVIAQIGVYSVSLQSPSGTVYRYLHLNMSDLAVRPLDHVKRGDRIGKVSNYFGDTKTTIHLHFDIKDSVVINGRKRMAFVPPYTSLVDSYKRLIGGMK